MNYQEFIIKEKSLLIAPAGYGKTYTLAECLKHTPSNEKQLIITHTHAGIASIKEKIKKIEIPSSKYEIETITGFAQKYTLAFYCNNDIPLQEDSKNYYPFIIKKATELIGLESIKRTIKYSYHGLFVDEYQDCTKSQHKLIVALSEILPTHILGDPMQGIFGFNEQLVDFETDLTEFDEVEPLDIPWRWNCEGNNAELGNSLKEIRAILSSKNKAFSFLLYTPSIEYIKISESDIYNNKSVYRKSLNKLLLNPENNTELNSLLLIVPEYFENNIAKGGIAARSNLKALIDFSNQLTLLEAIDNKDFYSISKKIDELVDGIGRRRKKIKALNDELFCKLFNKGSIDVWIAGDRIKNKREPNVDTRNLLEEKINSFLNSPSYLTLSHILLFMKNEMKFKCKRRDLLNSIIKSINIAITENKSVYQGMVSHKNIIRRVGRKIYGKCLGTTLLTKGLEFDTVAILNAHRFENHKHLYVALTRACKNLIIFSENDKLSFSN